MMVRLAALGLLLLCGLVSGFGTTPLSFTSEDGNVFAVVKRIGSFLKPVKFKVDVGSNTMKVAGVPSRYSKTAYEIDDAGNIYQDTFYWDKTIVW